MSRTYTNSISQDFNETQKLIKLKTKNWKLNYKQMFNKLKLFHNYFYKFRDVLEQLQYRNSKTYYAIQDGVEGIFDFIWLIVLARYKSCIVTFRSSMEMLVKGLMREYVPQKETNKFGNNIEIIIKHLKEELSCNLDCLKNKKQLSKVLEQNYTYEIRDLYKNLSQIVHGNYINENKKFTQYLDEITQVNFNYNQQQYNYIINEAIKLLKIILELTIMINFKYLSENMNSYKLNLIIQDLSSNFKKFKYNYLS